MRPAQIVVPALLLVLGLTAACGDPACPDGFYKVGNTVCRRSDAGGAVIAGEAGAAESVDPEMREDLMDAAVPPVVISSDAATSDTSDARAAAPDADLAADSAMASALPQDASVHCDPGSKLDGGVCVGGAVDPCAPNPCGAGLTCTRSPAATATCSATCAASGGIGCQPGDPCVGDADCKTGGDNNATCDATGKVCVTVCASTTIVSQGQLDAARYCKEINGDLAIDPSFATISAGALPYLARIRGSIAGGTPSLNAAAQSITIGNLQTVDGSLRLRGFKNLTLASFPRLTSVGADLDFNTFDTPLDRVSLPQLTTVQGGFTVAIAPGLTQLDVGKLQTVGGVLRLASVCKLAWSQVSRISGLVADASKTLSNVGCCTSSPQACTGSCACN